eukprot:Blabericola_migrator_1__1004@NODE_1253_length_4978_cov_98_123396_g847_i0_p2_GENE_NODE_1253_length_4978_cov_98_123396_g847_i0NODE_1253_length_4978_cov_98_123396_g847_i0_p2_ORF_typecomplete_len610_score150_20NMD3/PF04981_13/4_2e69DUF2572/PF10833_8/0_16_NODE_1253_length_4978_cov_98_123396_g847_i08522681
MASSDVATLRSEFGSVFVEDRALSELAEQLSQRHRYLSERRQLGQFLTETEEAELKNLEEKEAPSIALKQEGLQARLTRLKELVGDACVSQWEQEARAALKQGAPASQHEVGPRGQRMAFSTLATILCCVCGVATEVNDMRMCLDCIKAQADITASVSRSGVVHYCKNCERYESDQGKWLVCEPESKEMLALCVRKIKGLGDGARNPRLVDCNFIWTEPHSRRIKLLLTLQKEVFRGTTLQQKLTLEFKIVPRQCEECTKSVTPHLWIAQVQVRQRAEHKRSLIYLEQLVLAQNAHEHCINIVDRPDGLDFQFSKVPHANNFINFVRNFLPVKVQSKATQMVSHDGKSNTFHHKYTSLLEIAGVCRDDLVFLKKHSASRLGGVSQIMLCEKVSTGIRLRDPFTLRGVDIDNEGYWKDPFDTFMSKRDLTEHIVMNVEAVDYDALVKTGVAGRFLTGMMTSEEERSSVKKSWGALSKSILVEVELCKVAEMGQPDSIRTTRTHLGHVLKVGDIVECYDISRTSAMVGDREYDAFVEKIPFDIMVVRKVRSKKTKDRDLNFPELPKATMTGNETKKSVGYEQAKAEFLDDLEMDDDMQRNLANLIQGMRLN